MLKVIETARETTKIMQQLTQWQLRKEYFIRIGLKHMIQLQLKV